MDGKRRVAAPDWTASDGGKGGAICSDSAAEAGSSVGGIGEAVKGVVGKSAAFSAESEEAAEGKALGGRSDSGSA